MCSIADTLEIPSKPCPADLPFGVFEECWSPIGPAPGSGSEEPISDTESASEASEASHDEEVSAMMEDMLVKSRAPQADLVPSFPEGGLWRLARRPWTLHGALLDGSALMCGRVISEAYSALDEWPSVARPMCRVCFPGRV